jgi:4-amino-4-deoxy-L-arabinose transferase-like glycosyltransferase
MTATRPAATGPTAALPALAVRPITVVAAALAVVWMALSSRYGFHRDELYFLAAGDHLAWGYVDQPPLTPLLAKVSTTLFGDTPVGLRVVAMLGGVAIVFLTALIARELRGGRRAQLLAACCAAVSGYVLAVGHMVSTSTFDLLAWIAIAFLALRLLRTGDDRWWPALGLTIGLGLENKYLVLLLVGALLVALLVVGPRAILRSWWLAAGIAAAAVVALPNLWWQAANGWPQVTVAGGISSDDGAENRMMFIPLQLVQLSPFLVPIAVAGILRLFRDPSLRWARAVAFAYPVLCVVVVATGGKPYYALPLVLVMIAAGCEPAVRWTDRKPVRRKVLAIGMALAAITSAVITLPLLPPSAVGAVAGINKEQVEQIGWPELTSTVATAWARIPADVRDRAVIFTVNYGEAGAIAEYGPEHGLPAPYSGHMSYADWGPPPDSSDGPVVLVQHPDAGRRLESQFTGCRQVATIDNGKDIDPEEQGGAISLCDRPAKPWSQLWPALRRFY